MRKFFERLDRLADINRDGGAVAWLERIAFVFLLLTFASAPHSIAATQTAWIIGMLAWIIRLPLRPRIRFRFGPLDAALWAFFIWSVVSSLTSYEPLVSIDRLRGTAVFLIFYFVFYNVRTMRAASLAAVVMIASCMISVLWMPVERLLGRGVEIHGVAANSPLAKPGLIDGDTLLEVNKKKVTTPDEVVKGLETAEIAKVRFYRPDFELTIDVKRSDLLAGTGALEQLGITGWKKSHNWRSKGFYGHYTTYAEVLQLIGSLIFGLLIAGLAGLGFGNSSGGPDAAKPSRVVIGLLFLALLGTGLALLLTVTRGPQLGLAVSGGLIVLAGLGRKWFIAAVLIMLPVAIGGLIFLQQSRNVEFLDSKDESTKYREMMMRDGVRLWTQSPRHFILGVGMDSIQKHWEEWGLFDRGWQPMGHFHSTYLQLLVERGSPALLLWLGIIAIYARKLWKGLRSRESLDWPSIGLLLGAFGGLAGFATSGLVHYNLGDQEVAMVLFILMGLACKIVTLRPEAGQAVTETEPGRR